MRPALVNHDGDDDNGDYQKFYEQFIDGAGTSKYIDYKKTYRNDIYNVTGESLIPECLKFVKSIVDPDDPARNDSRDYAAEQVLVRGQEESCEKSLEMSAETAEEKDEHKEELRTV